MRLEVVASLAVASLIGGVRAQTACQVSDWSSWSSCESKESCKECNYGGGGPGSWVRPSGAPAAVAFPEVGDAAPLMKTRDKMARKAAAVGDDPAWRGPGGQTCARIAKEPRARCASVAGAMEACSYTCAAVRAAAAEAHAAGACAGGDASGFPCSGVDLDAWLPMSDMAGCGGMTNDNWGWTSEDGEEWGIIGCATGTAFARVGATTSDAFVPTASSSSSWRDVKTYDHYALIGSEASGHGMQIVDLERLGTADASASMEPDAWYGGFGSSHNVVVNVETAMAYGVGTDTCGGGLHGVSLADPLNPVSAGCVWSTDYVHDAQCVVYRGPDAEHVGKEICFLYSEDEIRIVDVTDLADAKQLSSLTYGAVYYAHQGWLNCEQTALFVDDELDEQGSGDPTTKTYVVDVRDLDAPAVLAVHEAAVAAIDHNQYVCGAYLYQANYEAGLRILDVSRVFEDAATMREVAYFDTHPSSNAASFNGAWNVYPFFDSGSVIVNAIDGGVAFVDPSAALAAQTRTRTVVGDATGLACPLLVQERSCSDAPTAAPAPAPTPRPSLSPAPTSDCGACDGTLVLALTTDDYPVETTWDFAISPSAPETCADASNSGGGYSDANADHVDTVATEVCAGQEYTFTIYDSWGDGICCDWGSGSYALVLDGSVEQTFGGDFGSSEAYTFTASGGGGGGGGDEDDGGDDNSDSTQAPSGESTWQPTSAPTYAPDPVSDVVFKTGPKIGPVYMLKWTPPANHPSDTYHVQFKVKGQSTWHDHGDPVTVHEVDWEGKMYATVSDPLILCNKKAAVRIRSINPGGNTGSNFVTHAMRKLKC